jgi:two-component system sensor histidine kinase QseC
MKGWRSWLQPSLARRLVVAQLLTLALTWLAALGFFAYQVAHDDSVYWPAQIRDRAAMVVSVAGTLADRPEALATALQTIDQVQRHEAGAADEPVGRTAMSVWIDDRLVFDTPGPPGPLTATALDQLERVADGGHLWRVYTHAGADGRVRVTLTRSADSGLVLTTLASKGLLVLPLLMAAPLLWLAAWVSVRLALRPWRRLSDELSQRAPGQLEPLTFQARHRELKPLTTAIDGLLGRVREGLLRERAFVADAAHALRTPLAAMRIHVEALQQLPQPPQAEPLLGGLSQSGERAGRLVSQLLSLTRSEAAPVQRASRIRLDALVQDRLAALQPLADRKQVELEFLCDASEAWIHADAEGLNALLDNLVENAIKYGPADGQVRLRLQQDGGCWQLDVDDQGPGIDPAHHDKVFERFYRVPGQMKPGSGLGLAIARAVVERQGGEIDLGVSALGGLRVRVRWPSA